MRKPLLLLLAVLLVAGCAGRTAEQTTGTALIAAGTTLDDLGKHYDQARVIFVRGCDVTKTIDAASCQKFTAFGQRFRAEYPKAVEAWRAARRANDAVGAHNAVVVVSQLATDLAVIALGGR